MIRVVVLTILLFFLVGVNSFSFAQSKTPVSDKNIQSSAKSEIEDNLSDKDEVDATKTAEMQEEVAYELAYPGMLPDNPLYFLKMIRDAVVKFLIADSVKKAEFNLLTSDKRLYASRLLLDNRKFDLSLETLIKSNNYFHEAVFSLSDAGGSGKEIKPLFDRMLTSAKKHKEVFTKQLIPNAPKELLEDFKKQQVRFESIEKSVMNIEAE